MYCMECGKEIPDSSKFCSFCGEKIEIPQSMLMQAQARKLGQGVMQIENKTVETRQEQTPVAATHETVDIHDNKQDSSIKRSEDISNSSKAVDSSSGLGSLLASIGLGAMFLSMFMPLFESNWLDGSVNYFEFREFAHGITNDLNDGDILLGCIAFLVLQALVILICIFMDHNGIAIGIAILQIAGVYILYVLVKGECDGGYQVLTMGTSIYYSIAGEVMIFLGCIFNLIEG